jgi:hypothetical protein
MGVAAAAAIPVLSSGNPQALDLAAEEVASAMRFARSEAMRTGEPRGFDSQESSQMITVFRVDAATSGLIYDVYHPVRKKLYKIGLKDHPFAAIDDMTPNPVYRGTCNKPRYIYFDTAGTPWCKDPETVLLEQYEVTLTRGPHARVVTLHGITGRVTIQ